VASLISGETDGVFRVNVRNKKNYMLEIRSTGYLSDMRKIDIPTAYIGETFFTNFYLDKIAVGRKVVMNNIFFETGKAVLTPSSFAELDKLTLIMNENKGMRIEISGHTDNTGSSTVNTRLSLERANSVSGYLKSKGIDASRIETKGFGSTQPIELNDTPNGRAANRRVEFKILEF
jgi:outer membrane protein OmpA-like peptidoglycan-associated protein